MISLRIIKIGLTTDTGLPKVNKLEARLKNDIVPAAMKDIAGTIKMEASKNTPDLQEESIILSKGKVTEMYAGGKKWLNETVGRPVGGRFFKAGEQLSVKTAILREEPKINNAGNRITLELGNVQEISKKSGFSWERSGGEVLNTLPFNGRLLQALEYGSAADNNIWIVVPRPDRKKLYPEPHVGGITKMEKIMPAYGMYSKARNKLQPELPNRIRQFITPQLQEFR